MEIGIDLGDTDGGDIATAETDRDGDWTARIRFGSDHEDRTAWNGEQFHVWAECRWGPTGLDAGSYQGGDYTFRPAHHR